MLLPQKFLNARRLENLVENQTSYTLNNAEMHIFETHERAQKIALKFNQPILASMISGKKIMHLEQTKPFDFLPGESVILPAGTPMLIDFPEAAMHKPTRCLALAVSIDKIRQIIVSLNETCPRVDGQVWTFTDFNFHFTNDSAIYGVIQRLLFLFTEEHPSKDLFADFMLKELIVRVLQKENLSKSLDQSKGAKEQKTDHHSRLNHILGYIRKHLDQPLTIQQLSHEAHMSESHFYRVFKNEMGISPIDFVNEERIKLATRLLHDPDKQIKEVYMECGFNSRSYFTRLFKRKNKASPREFQAKAKNKQL